MPAARPETFTCAAPLESVVPLKVFPFTVKVTTLPDSGPDGTETLESVAFKVIVALSKPVALLAAKLVVALLIANVAEPVLPAWLASPE